MRFPSKIHCNNKDIIITIITHYLDSHLEWELGDEGGGYFVYTRVIRSLELLRLHSKLRNDLNYITIVESVVKHHKPNLT